MMYYAIRYHHMTPMQWFSMLYGEKMVYIAMLHYEIKQKIKENEPEK